MPLSSPRFVGNARLEAASHNRPAMNWGEVGQAVRLVQQALLDLGESLPDVAKKFGSPHGHFDDETKAAVLSFQRKHGLVQDGAPGQNTLAKMDQLLKSKAAPALPPVPAESFLTHRFKVVFRSTVMPAIPEFVALEDTRRVYGLYGFRVDESGGMSLALSPTEALELNVIDGACLWDQESDEQAKLFALGGGRRGVAPTDIMVYYVNRIVEPPEKAGGKGNPLAGCAGHKPGSPACVVAATAAKYDMAHEIGHVLVGSSFSPNHHPFKTNLMFENAITADPPGLSESQVRAMRKSALCFPL
ncbi:MAG: peptidoglycan-binding protein [Gemmataceae bacterium]|nr:peptidoglycan-binding protein [Gemmataceae bacterium]